MAAIAAYARATRNLIALAQLIGDPTPEGLAADAGDPTAQHALAYRYKQGEGVPQDRAEAARWFRLSAEQGNATARQFLTHLGRAHTLPAPQKEHTDAK